MDPVATSLTMDRDRASAIAHTGIQIANPIPGAVLDRFIGDCALTHDDRLLDIGCGRGELVLRAVERTGCTAVGIDRSPRQIAIARAEAKRRVAETNVAFHEAAAEAVKLDRRSFDLVACVGSMHAYGGLSPALASLTELLALNGRLLIGDGYWTEPPTPAYLAGWGATADELPDLSGFRAGFEQHGLDIRAEYHATIADWDAYEEPWLANIDAHVEAHPDDPDTAGMRQWASETRARRELGPGVLGFALVVANRAG
jgi:cyclopropane fatty-acyl-phospholipid synthase-like methyltransferase